MLRIAAEENTNQITPVASYTTRLLAWMIDRMVTLVIAVPVLLIILSKADLDSFKYLLPQKLGYAVGALSIKPQSYYSYELRDAIHYFWICTTVIVLVTRIYYIITDSKGSSLGKKMLGIELVDLSNQKGVRVAFTKNVGFILLHYGLFFFASFFDLAIWNRLLIVNLIIILPGLITANKRTLADFISGVKLVKKISSTRVCLKNKV